MRGHMASSFEINVRVVNLISSDCSVGVYCQRRQMFITKGLLAILSSIKLPL